MVSLPWSKKEEKQKDLKAQLSELGIDFRTDDFFKDSLQNIDDNVAIFTDEQIEAMALNAMRKSLLKTCMRRTKYVMHHIAFAKPIEKERFGRAMEAARDLLHQDMERIFSRAADDAVRSEVLEDYAQMDILVGYSFDTPRVSVNKSVVVQTVSKHDNRYGTEEEEV